MKNKQKIILLILALFFILVIGSAIPVHAALAPEIEVIIPEEIKGDSIKEYAYKQVVNRFGKEHWESFNSIIEHESRWRSNVKNPASSAFGLCQTMMSVHTVEADFKTNPQTQIDWCIEYTIKRFKTPNAAWKYWLAHKYW